MNTSPVCCEPCAALRYCVKERNCCLECHFDYEEMLAFPFLSAPLQARILREHAWLERTGFPEAAVAAHAAWEEEVFRKHCPPEVCDIIERDHVAHGHGKLPSRVARPARQVNMPVGLVPPGRSSGMFSPRWATAAMR